MSLILRLRKKKKEAMISLPKVMLIQRKLLSCSEQVQEKEKGLLHKPEIQSLKTKWRYNYDHLVGYQSGRGVG